MKSLRKAIKSRYVVFVAGALAGVVLLLAYSYVQVQVARIDRIEGFLSVLAQGGR